MSHIKYMRGNQAAAEAARLARIEFMGAYPIPPFLPETRSLKVDL